MLSWQDSKHGYGLTSIFLHWLTALLIVALLAVALYADTLPRDDGRPWRFFHVSLGLLFIPVYLVRLYWRGRSGHPKTYFGSRLVTFWGELTWRVLLLAPAIMIATGPFLSWLHSRPLSFFGLFNIASPLAKNHELRVTLAEVHAFVGYTILAFLGLHLAGVIKHLVVDKENILKRMIIPARLDKE
jgi:cytochrome b561